MPKEIYTQNVFEKQVNGTIFQKEGRLNDFPYAGDGIFESWRYSFDAGKQVFRASNSGKVFEKRIVKDLNGNPAWTSWVEIPDAEAHGIQAIAVNDRPLQLPNSDGAIKIQVTPEMIDTYTKGEIYSLIDQKIQEQIDSNFVYVKWCLDREGNPTTSPKEVLKATFPEGGMIGVYYIVEPHPSTSGIQEKAQYFIWQHVQNPIGSPQGYLDWIEIDNPDMRAFVSYPAFDEHTHDYHQHLSGDFERQNWDAASGLLDVVSGKLDSDVSGIYERIENEAEIAKDLTIAVSGELHEHIADFGRPTSPHITPEEKENWNTAYTSIKTIPNDGNRYITLNGEYKLAYEQTAKGDIKTKRVFGPESPSLQSGQTLVENLLAEFNAITAGNNLIVNTQLQINGFNTQLTTLRFETVGSIDNITHRSPNYESSSGSQIWDIGNKPFEKLLLISESQDKTFSLSGVKLVIQYEPLVTANIGDSEKRLVLNLVGPEINPDTHEGEPMYNGKPLSAIIPDASLTAKWGRINGDIDTQNDLNTKLAKLLNDKISHGPIDNYDNDGNPIPEAHLRFDVYRDNVIPSLIQQPGNIFSEVEWVLETNNGDINHPLKDQVIVPGIKNKLLALKAKGEIPYSANLHIDFVSCWEDDDHNQIPVYFETDNPEIPASPVTASAKFEWNWPGGTFQDFDKIYLRRSDLPTANKEKKGCEHLDNVKLKIRCIKYGDWELQASGYQGTINGTNLFINSSGNITILGDSGKLTETYKEVSNTVISGVTEKIGADRITEIGGSEGIVVNGRSTKTIGGESANLIKGKNSISIEGDNSLTVNGNDKEYISGNKDYIISGKLTEAISGTYNQKISNSRMTIITYADTENIGGDQSSTVGGRFVKGIKGNSSIDIDKDSIATINGNSTATINGDSSLKIDGESKNIISGLFDIDAKSNIAIHNGGTLNLRNSSGISIFSQKDIKVDTNNKLNLNAISGIALESDFVNAYDEDTSGLITIYGQPIDKRYVNRKVAGEGNKIVQDITFELEPEGGALTLKKTLLSLDSGEYEVFSGNFDIVTEHELGLTNATIDAEISGRIFAINQETYQRISGDSYLYENHLNLSGLLDSNYFTKSEIDEKFRNEESIRFEEDEKLRTDIDTVSGSLFDEYYKKPEVDQLFKDIIEKDTESYDLVIHNNDELKENIDDGTFASSARILINSEVTEYTGNLENLDLGMVRYLHGEEPCIVDLKDLVISGYDNLFVDTIKFIALNKTLDSEQRDIKDIDIFGDTAIELSKYFDVYRLNIKNDAQIRFNNIIEGKEYIFYIDQPEAEKKVTIGNYIHNSVDLLNGLENQQPGKRTVIKAIGHTLLDEDGIIVTDVITGVDSITKSTGEDRLINLRLGNIEGEYRPRLDNSTLGKDVAVTVLTEGLKSGLYSFIRGSTVLIKAKPANIGWKNIIVEVVTTNDTRLIATGPCEGEGFSFKMDQQLPEGVELVANFKAERNEVPVEIDVAFTGNKHDYDEVLKNGIGFTEDTGNKAQLHYTNLDFNIILTSPFFLYKTTDNMGNFIDNKNQSTMKWKYGKLEELPPHREGEVPKLVITPHYWTRINSITNMVTESYAGKVGYGLTNKDNIFTFEFGPEDADDPITVINYSDDLTVEYEGPQSVRIRCDIPKDDYDITIATGSGFEKKWPLPISQNIGEFEIVFDKEFFFIGENSVTNKMSINWNKLDPFVKSGTWTIVSGNATVVGTTDEVDVTVPGNSGKGEFTIQFVPDLNPGLSAIKTIKVYQCPTTVEITTSEVLSTQNVKLGLLWNPSESILSNSEGKWSVDKPEFATIDENTGVLTTGPFRNETIEVTFIANSRKFDPVSKTNNGELLVTKKNITILANSYRINFVENDSNFISVEVNNLDTLGEYYGGDPIKLRISFKNGFKLSDETRRELEEAVGTLSADTVNAPAIYKTSFNMPFKDINIEIKSQAI